MAPWLAPRPCWIVGRATFTMKKSSTNMNVPIIRTASGHQRFFAGDREAERGRSVAVAVMPRACRLLLEEGQADKGQAVWKTGQQISVRWVAGSGSVNGTT